MPPSRGGGRSRTPKPWTVAVAAAAVLRWSLGGEAFKFRAPGGTMGVVFEGKDRAWLSGPVEMPFKGAILPS